MFISNYRKHTIFPGGILSWFCLGVVLPNFFCFIRCSNRKRDICCSFICFLIDMFDSAVEFISFFRTEVLMLARIRIRIRIIVRLIWEQFRTCLWLDHYKLYKLASPYILVSVQSFGINERCELRLLPNDKIRRKTSFISKSINNIVKHNKKSDTFKFMINETITIPKE